MRIIYNLAALALLLSGSAGAIAQTAKSSAKAKTPLATTFTNPVIYSDAPDPSIIRVGSDYYMVSTTMHMMPGAPVMKSKDLVNWSTVGYVYDRREEIPNYDLQDGKSVYGRGQWASSIRYHKGKFYVMFATNDPHMGYIYSATDPAGKWELVSKLQQFHDPSLLFDDDGKVYVFYGTGDLRELKSDLSGVQPNGVEQKTFVRDKDESGLLEGSQAFKYKGKYYLCMISMPRGGTRREVCYRADKITGPYEKKVILENVFETYGGVGQGGLVDAVDGKWYGMLFQDRGAIGRVPILMPCRWVDGWPMLGDENGRVPKTMEKPFQGYPAGTPLVASDDFKSKKLGLYWQWNHNPVNTAWSLSERAGFLRLKTSRVVDNMYKAPNTLTQRTEGPQCSGSVALDVSKMKDGDVAGFSAFNGHAALLSVIADGTKKYLTMSTNVVDLDNNAGKLVRSVAVDEKARVELLKNTIYLRIDCDFAAHADQATFYYSLDNVTWTPIGTPFKMRFDYQKLFMGTRFAIFNYATKSTGGYVDVDGFQYQREAK